MNRRTDIDNNQMNTQLSEMSAQEATITPSIEESWRAALQDEFNSDYFKKLKQFLVLEKRSGKIIYPNGSEIFSAFNLTPFEKVKVVIIGQDPYHGAGQAHGLCFSVKKGIKPPPSLMNIFKEIKDDVGMEIPPHGNLSHWATQGVLLLNSILTVEANTPASHQNKGWEQFTDSVIRNLSNKKSGIVFLLWGNYAKAKVNLIDQSKHHILSAAHPSPFSAYSGFFGCKHFSNTNSILKKQSLIEIDWSL